MDQKAGQSLITIIDGGSRKVPEIAEQMRNAGFEAEIVALAAANQHDFARSSGVILSGGPHLFTDPGMMEKLTEQFAFIDRLQTPVLGICLGHQGIARRFGAPVYRGEPCRQTIDVNVVAEHELFAGIVDVGTFREDHCEGVELPDGFELLATSSYYPVEGMAHRERPIFGVQFHPESSGPDGDQFLRNFLSVVRRHSIGIESEPG